MKFTLEQLLTECQKKNGSDLHITVGAHPQIRVDGDLVALTKYDIISPDQAEELCLSCLSKSQREKVESGQEIDTSFSVGKNARIRANIFWQQGTTAGAFRCIPFEIPDPEALGIPPVVMNFTKRPRGLVLVTGPTGSGKSTTLAAMLNEINQTVPKHISTVEDPIEFIYRHNKCLVEQREVGNDTASFQTALKYIFRQDPDVVLIGEMRDLETVRAAITTAETGHLVFATLHTNSAVQTIDRIIDVFPPHQQPQVRSELSFILEGVVSQQLLPKEGGGRVLALEVLIPDSAIRNLIREAKTHQVYAQMQMGGAESGNVTMNQSLAQLVQDKIISYDEGLNHATNIQDFRSLVGKR